MRVGCARMRPILILEQMKRLRTGDRNVIPFSNKYEERGRESGSRLLLDVS